MLPAKLIKVFEESDEDDIDIVLLEVIKEGADLLFKIKVKSTPYFHNSVITQDWHIRAINVKKSQITFDIASLMEISKDHPLLWEFTDNDSQLYYAGSCENTYKLFQELYETHDALYGKYEAFEVYGFKIKEDFYLKPLPFRNGLFADGPNKLMEKYAEVLLDNGLDYNIISSEWLGMDNDLQVLFIGNSFIIAKEFLFEKL